jgi:hypothetical protein
MTFAFVAGCGVSGNLKTKGANYLCDVSIISLAFT